MALIGLVVSGIGIATSVPLVYLGYGITGLSVVLDPRLVRDAAIGWPWACALSAWMLFANFCSPFQAGYGLPSFLYAWPAMIVWTHAIGCGGERRIVASLAGAGIGAAMAAGLAWTQFTVGYRQADAPLRLSTEGVRWQQSSGFYSHWIRHANAQAFVTLWLCAWFRSAAPTLRSFTPVIWLIALVGFVTIVISGARGAVLSFVGGTWILVFYMFSRRQVVIVTLVLAGLTTAAVSLASTDYQNRVGNALAGQDGRIFIWHTAWETFCRHPLTGVGDRGYDEAAAQTVAAGLTESGPEGPRMGNAHNSFLSMLVLYGVPGFLLWCGWLTSVTWHLWRSRHLHPAIWPFTLATMAIFLIGGLTEDLAGYTSSRFQLLFGLALASGLVAHRRSQAVTNT